MTVWCSKVLLWIELWIGELALFGNRIFADISKLSWGCEHEPQLNMTDAFTGRRKHCIEAETPGKDVMWWQRQRFKWCTYNPGKPGTYCIHQKLEEEDRLHAGPTGSWFWTSSFQNCEKIHFCCLSHLPCGVLLWHQHNNKTPQILNANIRLTIEIMWHIPVTRHIIINFQYCSISCLHDNS